jgi:hypothetical protein
MIDKRCPICNTVQSARVSRVDTGCAEWECSGCGGRWVVKDGHPGEAFAFFPADIEAAESDEVEPFFEESP